MPGTIAPFPKHQFFDNNGNPASGYQLFTYTAGTDTKLSTYTDVDLLFANTDPIILDSAGRCTIFLPAASFKFVFTTPLDTDPPTSPIWTVDNVSAVSAVNVNQDIIGVAGEDLTFLDCVYCSDGFGAKNVGEYYKADATDVETSTNIVVAGFATADVATGATGSFRMVGRLEGFASLTVGVNYFMEETPGAITFTAPVNRRCMGFADTATSLVIAPWGNLYVP